MRFMVIVKADKMSEAGALPDEKLLAEMGKYNEELARAGVLLAAEGLSQARKAPVRLGDQADRVIDGPFADEGAHRRFLADSGESGKRRSMGQTLSEPPSGIGGRDRDPPGLRAVDFGEALTPELRQAEERVAENGREREALIYPAGFCTDAVKMGRSVAVTAAESHRAIDGSADRAPGSSLVWPASSRRRSGRGPRPGRWWRRNNGHDPAFRQSRRSAHGRREASGHRRLPPDKRLERKHAELSRALETERNDEVSPTPRLTMTSATTCCGSSSRPAIQSCLRKRASR
jgi:hypothetical protein